MDWYNGAAILIASLSLAVSFATLILTEKRLRKAGQQEERSRLSLTTERLEEGFLVELAFVPLGAHTRYTADLKILEPRIAYLSKPLWRSNQGPGLISVPSPEFDYAGRKRELKVELEPITRGGTGRAKVVAYVSNPTKGLTISVAINDVATGKTVLQATETLTA